MKRTLVTAILSSLVTAMLMTAGAGRITPAAVEAQSAAPRSDLVTAFRQDATAMFNTIQTFRSHRQEYVYKNVNFVSGDLIGSNITTTFNADDVDQMISDMTDICNSIEQGGTIPSGQWGNVIKVK